jgi:FAD/FMN-containing dehydrogenase
VPRAGERATALLGFADHGIGSSKRDWLSLSRSQAEIDAFRALKRALDPDGILNPNVLLPPLASSG